MMSVRPDTKLLKDIPEGYPQLAECISKAKDHAIFRKFQSLNARNLLYYQSQLTDVEAQLQEIDSTAQDSEREALRSWNRFSAEDSRWDLVYQLRKLLSEYNSALLQYHQTLNLANPRRDHVQGLNDWIKDTKPISDHAYDYLERHVAQGDLPSLDDGLQYDTTDLVTLSHDADSILARIMRKSFFKYVFMVSYSRNHWLLNCLS